MPHYPPLALVLGLSVFCASFSPSPVLAEERVWDPLARPVAEADTLFLPDLSSVESIKKSGGFLCGNNGDETSSSFEFGPGKFGPAVRGKPGPYNFVFFPVDGLLASDEFTVEFWARWDKPWAALKAGRGIFAIDGVVGNRIQVIPYEGTFHVHVGHLESVAGARFAKGWQKRCDDLKLVANAWHAIALTFKQNTLRVFVNGVEVGKIDGVRWLPVWSDDTRASGIQLGGQPGNSTGFWISDVRFSRTARTPGRVVALRPLDGKLSVDARKVTGRVPPHLLGALHPAAGRPRAQIEPALHVIRTDKLLTATPMKRGEPDGQHPARGKSGRFAYDWQVVDRSFDWLKDHGVAPYVSIDSTPSILGGGAKPFQGKALARDLSAASGFSPEPPNNLDDWAAIVGDFVHHVRNVRKYDVRWWSVWNEPDFGAFWNAGVERYLDLYAVTVRAVRAADPKARVGGPETAGFNEKWVQALFRRCAKHKLPLDFIAYHDYSGNLSTPDQVRASVDGFAKEAGFPTSFPVLVGEFNWQADNMYKTGVARFRDGMWHLRAFGASYTTAFLTRMVELPGFEQLVYSHTAYENPRQGGWASTQLLGPRGQQWAPYNALKGWKQTVGSERLSATGDLPPGVFSLATRSPETGAVGVVLVNHGFAQRKPRPVTLTLHNLEAGRWELRRMLVDPKHSSRWDIAEDRDEGKAQDDLQTVEQRTLEAKAGTPLELRLELPVWSSNFIRLNRVK